MFISPLILHFVVILKTPKMALQAFNGFGIHKYILQRLVKLAAILIETLMSKPGFLRHCEALNENDQGLKKT